jgi:hypothetical protein
MGRLMLAGEVGTQPLDRLPDRPALLAARDSDA